MAYGYCQCGCGQKTKIASRSSTERGWKRGEPLRYLNGHNGRVHSFAYREDPATGCWVWLGSKTWNGYGQGSRDGQPVLAHRWYYEQAYGPIPKGLDLDHLCRNRACVRPDHCEPVTSSENRRRGSATLLTEQQVREIRAAPRGWGTGRRLAQEYGVHECTISAIRHGRLWPDVT